MDLHGQALCIRSFNHIFSEFLFLVVLISKASSGSSTLHTLMKKSFVSPFLEEVDHHRTTQRKKIILADFLSCCYYRSGTGYDDVESLTEILMHARPLHNLLIYLALPPNLFAIATLALRDALHRMPPLEGFVRLIVEKPFGHDTKSCQILLHSLQKQQWRESNLFRIDHYLGKVAVREIMQLRQQSNVLLNDSRFWNGDQMQSVHIILKESFGVEGRGGYYDSYGVIRDVVQNHLLQILSLITMELPNTSTPEDGVMHAETIRDAKVQLLQCIPPITKEHCLLGQYQGYADDKTIRNKGTKTATYACLRLFIHKSTWRNVPFVLEAGKALDEGLCEVRFHLRSHCRWNHHHIRILRIQPNPGLYATMEAEATPKPLSSSSWPGPVEFGAYASLVLDALQGDSRHFVRDDELLEAWRIFTPLLRELDSVQPESYTPGTPGPTRRAEFVEESLFGRSPILRSSL
jgi:glucose-6-phosphate 1-dehydrogenase